MLPQLAALAADGVRNLLWQARSNYSAAAGGNLRESEAATRVGIDSGNQKKMFRYRFDRGSLGARSMVALSIWQSPVAGEEVLKRPVKVFVPDRGHRRLAAGPLLPPRAESFAEHDHLARFERFAEHRIHHVFGNPPLALLSHEDRQGDDHQLQP